MLCTCTVSGVLISGLMILRYHVTDKGCWKEGTEIGQFYERSGRSIAITTWFLFPVQQKTLEVNRAFRGFTGDFVWYFQHEQWSCLRQYLLVIHYSFVLCNTLIVTCSKVQMCIVRIFTIISIITLATFKFLARILFVVICVFFHCFPTL